MKIAINKCYGGFALSPRAVQMMAQLNGDECYFFENLLKTDFEHSPISIENLESKIAKKLVFWSAYKIKNPDFEKMKRRDEDGSYKTANAYSDSITIDNHVLYEKRTDKKLIATIEKLGAKASDRLSQIEIVEIPDDVSDWYIDDYDGIETIREGRTWQ